jgi:hypothetical protein
MNRNNEIGYITYNNSEGIIKKVHVTRQFWIKHPDLSSCVLYLRSLNITDFKANTITYTKI